MSHYFMSMWGEKNIFVCFWKVDRDMRGHNVIKKRQASGACRLECI